MATFDMTYVRCLAILSLDEVTMTTVPVLLEHLYEGDVVDTADVARVSNTNPRSVSRWKAEQATPRRATEERLLELRAVVDLARRVMTDSATRSWLRSPNPDLGYEKPLDLIAQGSYQRVIDLLLALAEGVTG
jgi:putative toxin-antitoxin system antitoxin component (TIGR02293 family)